MKPRYINVGRVRVDTNNKVVMGIVRAGAKAGDTSNSHLIYDAVDKVNAAVAKRQRRALKRINHDLSKMP